MRTHLDIIRKLADCVRKGNELRVVKVKGDEFIASTFNRGGLKKLKPEMDNQGEFYEFRAYSGLLDYTYQQTQNPYKFYKLIQSFVGPEKLK